MAQSSVRYHHVFERHVPAIGPFRGAPRIFSLKIENLDVGGAPQPFVDAVLVCDDGRVISVPFIAMVGAEPIFPAAAAPLGSLLEPLAATIGKWAQSKGGEVEVDVFGQDPQLLALLADESPEAPVVPGLATAARVRAVVDRYSHLLPFACGRRVLDLTPGAGYGARLFIPWARLVHAVSAVPGDRAVAERLGYLGVEATPPSGDYDLVVGVSATAATLPSVLQAARALCAPGGVVAVGGVGDAVDEALHAAGVPARAVWPMNVAPPGGVPSAHVGISAPDEPVTSTPAAVPSSVQVSATPLRVLILLRSTARAHPGGDTIQAERTAQWLRSFGHHVEISSDRHPRGEGFDVVHVTNITAPEETLPQLRALETFEGAIVMTPIFLDLADEMMWGSFASVVTFRDRIPDEDLERSLQALAERRIRSADGCEPPPARTYGTPTYVREQRDILSRVDYLLVNAFTEAYWIRRHLDESVPFSVVPTCVDSGLYRPEAGAAFERRYGMRGFILQTARLDSRKNHLCLAHAMRRRPERTLLTIGRGFLPNYGSMLESRFPPNVLMLPDLPEDELAGACAACKVFVLPSWCEVVSLSSLNAAACEASLVLSRNSAEHEVFGDDAEYCDPGSIDSIVRAIDRAFTTHDERRDRRAALRERIVRDYSWERAARATEAAYYRVRAYNPRGRARRSPVGVA